MPLDAPVMSAQRPATGSAAYSLLTPGAGGTCDAPDMSFVFKSDEVVDEVEEEEEEDDAAAAAEVTTALWWKKCRWWWWWRRLLNEAADADVKRQR